MQKSIHTHTHTPTHTPTHSFELFKPDPSPLHSHLLAQAMDVLLRASGIGVATQQPAAHVVAVLAACEDDGKVKQFLQHTHTLTDMGFASNAAVTALCAGDGDLETALEQLMHTAGSDNDNDNGTGTVDSGR